MRECGTPYPSYARHAVLHCAWVPPSPPQQGDDWGATSPHHTPVHPDGKPDLPVLPIRSTTATLRPAHAPRVPHARGIVPWHSTPDRMVRPCHHVRPKRRGYHAHSLHGRARPWSTFSTHRA